MKKEIWILMIAILWAGVLYAQDSSMPFSAVYQQTPFKTVVKEIESRYPVQFFFADQDIDSVRVTAVFQNTPLRKCMDILLDHSGLNYFFSGSQIVIYKGFQLKTLFPGSELVTENFVEDSPANKMSKSELQQLQYQILNVGMPGNRKTGTATITGYLKNYESGEPVIGGTVTVPDLQKGTSSDANGFYRISLPVGSHTLHFSSIGMKATSRNIHLYSDGRLDVVMETKAKVLEDAVIVGHGQGNLGQVQTGMEKIDNIMIKSIPAMLGEADVIKSVLTLPGVQTVGEGTSGFNVRGGNTDQNLILIDQAPIYYPAHFFGNFSAINSEIVDNATLYKGSIPVRYGGRISSVFEINTIEGNHRKLSGSAGISPISAHINLDGPLFSKRSTFVTSFRSTYSNWILRKIKVPQLYNSKAGFYDFQTKLNIYIREKNKLQINFYTSNDNFRLHSDTSYTYHNLIGSVALEHKFSPKLKSSSRVSCSLFNYLITNEAANNESFSLTHSLADYSMVNDFEYFTNSRMKLDFGADLHYYSINPGEQKPMGNSNLLPVLTSNEHALEYGVYLGDEFNVSSRFKMEGGIRLSGLLAFGNGKRYVYAAGLPYDVENITDTVYTPKLHVQKIYMIPEWRLAMNYMVNAHGSLKISYNKTAQYIHMLSNSMAISPTDTWKLSDKYLLPETGNQLSFGYFRNARRNRIEASAEIYYKWVRNTKEYKSGADLLLNDHIETEIVNGEGKSYGLELSVEKSGGRIYGRIDYTYSRTLIRSLSPFKEEQINDGAYFPANYDKPHNLNVVANYKASRRFIISCAMTYSTGRPITYPVSKYQLGGEIFLQYSKYNQYRIPAYFRTDLSLTYNGNLKKNQLAHSAFTFSLYNVTARKNAYSVFYRSEGGRFDAYQLSIFGTIIPTITYTIKF